MQNTNMEKKIVMFMQKSPNHYPRMLLKVNCMPNILCWKPMMETRSVSKHYYPHHLFSMVAWFLLQLAY